MDELRELDARCARALNMAWTKPTHGRCCTCQVCGWDYDNCQCGYTEDPEKARLLEDEIERRGLGHEYQYRLSIVVGVHPSSWDQRETLLVIPWLLLRATPEQRARAFLEAVEQ
jgi:hypothetical protein